VTRLVTAPHSQARLPPCRPLVHVGHGVGGHTSPRFLPGGRDHLPCRLLQLTDRATAHRDPKQIGQHLPRRPLREAIGPGTQRDRGLPPRAVRPTRDPRRPGSTGALPARGTLHLMPLLFGHYGLQRGNLHHLRPKRRGIVPRQGGVAAATHLGFEDHHLIDFFHGEQTACLTRVTGLRALTAHRLTAAVTSCARSA
jgi:hypothetical protein